MADKKIVFITGGNTGLGYSIVECLIGESDIPYTVLMGSRSLEKAETAISTLKEKYPNSKSDILPIQVDIESDETILAAFKQVEEKHGKVDILINNAGTLNSFPDHPYQYS